MQQKQLLINEFSHLADLISDYKGKINQVVNFTIRDKFFSGKNKKANCLLIFNNKFLEIAK